MMSQIMQYSFRLFGPRKGRTVAINGHKFVDGVYRAVVSPHNAANLMKVLSYYGAYAKGTPEYDAALAKEENHGADEVPSGAEQGGADALPREGEPAGRTAERRGGGEGVRRGR